MLLMATTSAEYALRVVTSLDNRNIQEANHHLQDFRNEGIQTRGFGKEALVKLQALGIIEDLYHGDINVPKRNKIRDIQTTLQEIMSTPRPK